jgi:RHS repeat-associated protein
MKTCTNNKIMTAARYACDALGRRIWKYDPTAAATNVYYYYNDQWQILCEYTADTTCRQWFTYGNYIDEVLSRNAHPYGLILAMQYYTHDHLYSPAALASYNGFTVLERYEYDAYGRVQILSSGFSVLSSSQYANPFAFTGRQLDVLDNGNLHHMHYRHRDYCPTLGRFLQHDPLGYVDGMGLYEYVKSNPIIEKDPKGTHKWTHEECKEIFDRRFSGYAKEMANCMGMAGSSFGKDVGVCLAGCSLVGIGTGGAGAKLCLEVCGGLSTGVNLAVYGACAAAAMREKQSILQADDYCTCRANGGNSKCCHDQANTTYPDPPLPWWAPIFAW